MEKAASLARVPRGGPSYEKRMHRHFVRPGRFGAIKPATTKKRASYYTDLYWLRNCLLDKNTFGYVLETLGKDEGLFSLAIRKQVKGTLIPVMPTIGTVLKLKGQDKIQYARITRLQCNSGLSRSALAWLEYIKT